MHPINILATQHNICRSLRPLDWYPTCLYLKNITSHITHHTSHVTNVTKHWKIAPDPMCDTILEMSPSQHQHGTKIYDATGRGQNICNIFQLEIQGPMRLHPVVPCWCWGGDISKMVSHMGSRVFFHTARPNVLSVDIQLKLLRSHWNVVGGTLHTATHSTQNSYDRNQVVSYYSIKLCYSNFQDL